MTAPVVGDDLASMQREVTALLGKTTARLVVCADLTGASVFSEDLADKMAKFFRPEVQRLERVAVVVGGGATFFLQVERLLREGGTQSSPGSRPEPTSSNRGTRGSDPQMGKRTPTRRAFRAPGEAMTWLDEVLTPEERARLRMFLEAPRPSQ